ncbi:uncharacterized protein MYCFIDRAFT_197437 [Pseudocercospora fijiensis CIRAD86]|uniref:Uncharacterized protein n=1 Tax=Pseudocercospora fijiensis (strain CIRAD86) TaxID=383855 RepID=M2ZTD0_PSEFD|nr:uncharacterized protein MYCFIDRAFT_197437 [Pseudocercospora fijiensis CIRAD86]EME82269.1 hypothetical protein MYCFIDRAFT_197437 [Pseudocercospora fijiensis CIRAD86]
MFAKAKGDLIKAAKAFSNIVTNIDINFGTSGDDNIDINFGTSGDNDDYNPTSANSNDDSDNENKPFISPAAVAFDAAALPPPTTTTAATLPPPPTTTTAAALPPPPTTTTTDALPPPPPTTTTDALPPPTTTTAAAVPFFAPPAVALTIGRQESSSLRTLSTRPIRIAISSYATLSLTPIATRSLGSYLRRA